MKKSMFTIILIGICISVYCQKNSDLVKDFPYANTPLFNNVDYHYDHYFNEVWKDPKCIGDTTSVLNVYRIEQYGVNPGQIYKNTFHFDDDKNILMESSYRFKPDDIKFILTGENYNEYNENNTIKLQVENSYESSTGELMVQDTIHYDENGNRITRNHIALYDISQNSITDYFINFIDGWISTQKIVAHNPTHPIYTCDSFIYHYTDTLLTGFDQYTVYRVEELPAQIHYDTKYETRINFDLDTITTKIYRIIPGYSDSVDLLDYTNLIFSTEGDTIKINFEFYGFKEHFGELTRYRKNCHKYIVKDGLEIESHHEFYSLEDFTGSIIFDSLTHPRAKSESHVYHTYNEEGKWLSSKKEFTSPNLFESKGIIEQTINYTSYIPETLLLLMSSDFETTTKKDFRVFPNPCKSELNIQLETQGKYSELSVVTLSGNTVLLKNLENTEFINLNIDKLAKGMYILQLKGNDIISNEKIIVF